MEVNINFEIRDRDTFGEIIPTKEKRRIINGVVNHLKKQFNVSSISEPKTKG